MGLEMELVFTGEFPPMKGGIGNFVYSRCLSPPPSGLQVLAAESAGCREWDLASNLKIKRFQYQHGGTLLRRAEQAWRSRRALKKELNRNQYRLVTANVLFPFGWMAGRFKSVGYRLAMFCHGAELLSAKMSAPGRIVYSQAQRNVDLFIANSPMTADTLVEHGADPKKISVIYPPIDTNRFYPSVDGSVLRNKWTCNESRGPVLLGVCRLDDIGKGIDTMFAVVAELRKNYPDIRYVIVGGGTHFEHYRKLAEDFGIGAHVIITGRVPDEDLPKCYAACDLFVLLSRRVPELAYYEGFGIVYREAMACGKPAIVSREAGFRDFSDPGNDSLVVDPRNVDEVVSACLEVLNSPQRAADMGRKACVSAARPTDWSPLNDLA